MLPLAFIVALGAATLALLVVTAVALARQGARLASELARFQREVTPLLEELRTDADRAASRLEEMQRRPDGTLPRPR